MDSPGPSTPRASGSRPRAVAPERVYTGPDPSKLAAPRTRTQAEKYFARVANENVLPNRLNKLVGIGGWIGSAVAIATMALYVDFGEKEHVFSPVRRAVDRWTNDMFTLSPRERSVMGMKQQPIDKPFLPDGDRPS